MSQDVIKVKGVVQARLVAPDGAVKEIREAKANLIVTTGKHAIADQLLASPTLSKPTHMGIGTGTTAPAVGNTALVTEVGTRQSLSKTRSGNVVTLVASFGAGVGTGAITEAGIFTAASSGTMYSRIVFAAINKGSNDTLELTWTYTIG
jgi:hypothetical protein